jgi:hypothetical protein
VVNFDLNLLNPKGLYCIMTSSFSVFTNKKITICKKAKVASDVATYTNIQTTANLLRVGCD